MAHEERKDSDQLSDNWFSNFEDQCLEELEGEPDLAPTLEADREFAVQKLWLQFQNTATAIAQMYKGKWV
jgi:hypothetical protein